MNSVAARRPSGVADPGQGLDVVGGCRSAGRRPAGSGPRPRLAASASVTRASRASRLAEEGERLLRIPRGPAARTPSSERCASGRASWRVRWRSSVDPRCEGRGSRVAMNGVSGRPCRSPPEIPDGRGRRGRAARGRELVLVMSSHAGRARRGRACARHSGGRIGLLGQNRCRPPRGASPGEVTEDVPVEPIQDTPSCGACTPTRRRAGSPRHRARRAAASPRGRRPPPRPGRRAAHGSRGRRGRPRRPPSGAGAGIPSFPCPRPLPPVV